MTVEVIKVGRGTISAHLSVVGNLIGEATVDVAPKTGGRLTTMSVKLGDRVRRGQIIGKVEDREIVETEVTHVLIGVIRDRDCQRNEIDAGWAKVAVGN